VGRPFGPVRSRGAYPRRRLIGRVVLVVAGVLALQALLLVAALEGHAASGSLPGRIVFVTRNGVIGEMRPDGTPVRRIGRSRPGTEAGIDSPMLSPDGARLLFFGGEGTLDILDLASGASVTVAGNPGADHVYAAGWLTSETVAFVSWQGSGAAEIEVVDADGSARHPVVRDAAVPLPTATNVVAHLGASPDGTEVAFVSSSGGIDAVAVGAGRIRRIVPPEGTWAITGMSWAPGTSLLFSEALGDVTTRVRQVRPDGSGLRTVLTGPDDQQPSWGPDGAHFLVVRPSTGHVAIVDAATGAARTVGPAGIVEAAWGASAAAGPSPSPSASGTPSATPTPGSTASPSTRGGGPPPGTGGTTAPSFAQSVVTPGQLGLRLTHVVTNLLLALAIVLLIPLVTEVFNSTFEANYARITRPFAGLARFASVALGPLRRRAVLAFAASMLVVSLLYCFLDPTFGWHRRGLATYLGMLGGLVLVTLVFDAVAAWSLWRRHGARPQFRPYAGGVVLAAACVLVSRVAQFQPGYLLGAIAGFAFAVALSEGDEGRLAARSALWMLGLSLVAWALTTPVAHTPHPGLGVQVVDSVLAAVVVAGIEGAAFGLIPIRFLVGEKVIAWSRAGWTAIFGVSVFAFVSIVLNPRGNYVGSASVGPVWATVALLVSFTAATTGLWAYFRWRPEPPATKPQTGVREPTRG
jgi:hypothetical protein